MYVGWTSTLRVNDSNFSSPPCPTHLTPALDSGEWSASRPGRFTARQRALSFHCRRFDAPKKRSECSEEGKRDYSLSCNLVHCTSCTVRSPYKEPIGTKKNIRPTRFIETSKHPFAYSVPSTPDI